MNKYTHILSYSALLLVPVVVWGQTFGSLIGGLVAIINTLVAIVMTLSLLVFFYGLARYVYNMGTGSATAYRDGYALMFWGVLVFFVMGSVWGIINLVANSIF